MSTYVITGASGFLGRPVVERLMTRNPDATVVGINRSRRSDDGVLGLAADIRDRSSLERIAGHIPGRITALVHLAAHVPRSPSEDTLADSTVTNVRGTANLLETFGRRSDRIVYASSVEVLGFAPTNASVDERACPAPQTFYGASKLAGEQLVRIYAEHNNVSWAALRFSVMFGAFDPIARAVPNFIDCALRGEDLEVRGGDELRDYLHVADAAQAIALAATSSESGVFNVGTGTGTTIRAAAEAVIELTRSDAEIRVVPAARRRADLVLNPEKAASAFGFRARRLFPNGLEEQIACHRSARSFST